MNHGEKGEREVVEEGEEMDDILHVHLFFFFYMSTFAPKIC